jgi:thiosulfate/3-mercaptopyruvate sulfurtransferase
VSAYTTIVQPEVLREHLDDPRFVVIDCRHLLSDFSYGKKQYDETHIPGAYFAGVEDDLAGRRTGKNGRHPMPDPETFAQFLRSAHVHDATQIVAYDDGADMFAPRLWFLSKWIGHEYVAVLDGGFALWKKLGYPVTSAVREHRAGGSLRPRVRNDLLVDAEHVLAHGSDGTMHLLDARAADRFAGKNETIDPVAGHIPGAKNHPFKENFGADGRFKSADDLRETFAALGRSSAIVHQCGSGVSAAVNLLAMEHASLPGSRLYAGSWSEWISDPTRPVH